MADVDKYFLCTKRYLLKPKQSAIVTKWHDSGRLKFYDWEPPKEEDEDGRTVCLFDEKTKEKYIEVYIRKSVVESRFVCWILSTILHELGHVLHYLDPSVTHDNTVPVIQVHGDCWENVLSISVNRGKLKQCAFLLHSPVAKCLYQGACIWCAPEDSAISKDVLLMPKLPEFDLYGGICKFCDTKDKRPVSHMKKSSECAKKYKEMFGTTYSNIVRKHNGQLQRAKKRGHNCDLPSVCDFCPGAGGKYLQTHLKYSPDCKKKYMDKYEVETDKDLQSQLKKHQNRIAQRNRRDRLNRK